MTPFPRLVDGYVRKARVYPALLVMAPALAALVAVFGFQPSIVQSLFGISAAFGGTFLLSQLARDAGKKLEIRLFKDWGGVPSVTILRHRDPRLDRLTKARYHGMLSRLVEGTTAPTIESESRDPRAADQVYSAWSHYLRVATRDPARFELLFKENVNYGYRRNLVGLRSFAVLTCAASIGALAGHWYRLGWVVDEKAYATVGAIAGSAIMLAFWIGRFNQAWVRVPADEYAKRLVETTDILVSKGEGS